MEYIAQNLWYQYWCCYYDKYKMLCWIKVIMYLLQTSCKDFSGFTLRCLLGGEFPWTSFSRVYWPYYGTSGQWTTVWSMEMACVRERDHQVLTLMHWLNICSQGLLPFSWLLYSPPTGGGERAVYRHYCRHSKADLWCWVYGVLLLRHVQVAVLVLLMPAVSARCLATCRERRCIGLLRGDTSSMITADAVYT